VEAVVKSVEELTVFLTECKILHLPYADFFLRYHKPPPYIEKQVLENITETLIFILYVSFGIHFACLKFTTKQQ